MMIKVLIHSDSILHPKKKIYGYLCNHSVLMMFYPIVYFTNSYITNYLIIVKWNYCLKNICIIVRNKQFYKKWKVEFRLLIIMLKRFDRGKQGNCCWGRHEATNGEPLATEQLFGPNVSSPLFYGYGSVPGESKKAQRHGLLTELKMIQLLAVLF